MADEVLFKEFELLLEKKLREVERIARSEADRARNQAIGALSFFALVLSIVGFFGGSVLVRSWAREAATARIDQVVPDYTAKLDRVLEAAGHSSKVAQDNALAARQASGEVAKVRDRIGSGVFPGDLAANGNRWGECQWIDFSEDKVGLAIERLGREGSPDYGCPDGTFMTHIDHDDVRDGHKVIMHTRCCKP